MIIENEDVCVCGHTAWAHRGKGYTWEDPTHCRGICSCPLFKQETTYEAMKREHPEKLAKAGAELDHELLALPVELL